MAKAEAHITSVPSIRFGLYDLVEHRPDTPLQRLYAERFELIRTAEAAGFWGYHTTEHHLNPADATPSPNVYLAAVAQHTHSIRLCTLVNIVVLYHPIRLAEELVMLDHLSNGRLEIGVGKGVSPVELRLMGHDPDEAHDQFDEALARLLGCLEGDRIDGAPKPAMPLQRPLPPLWYAGNAEYAGRRNLNLVLGGPLDRIVERVALHRALIADPPALGEQLNHGTEATIGVSRHIYVGTDSGYARERACQAWERYDANLRSHFERVGLPRASNPTLDGDGAAAIQAGALVAGTPDEVAESLIEVVRRSGVDYLLGSFCWGDLNHAEAMASLRLFIDVVIPHVHAHAVRR